MVLILIPKNWNHKQVRSLIREIIFYISDIKNFLWIFGKSYKFRKMTKN